MLGIRFMLFQNLSHSTFEYEGAIWAGVHDRRLKSDGVVRLFTPEDVLIYPCNYLLFQ